ncbi:MAG: hypothetical protein C0490_10515 [Marivirga sp.]|nr:hypothetical protein [Marivirga sp.]
MYLALVDYRIEKLSAQNIHHLIPLYQAVFKQTVTFSFFQKKYNTRSLGVEFIGFIAFTPTGMAAGYYGVIPCLFEVKGQTVLAAQSADTMTHPDHRKKGLFNMLATRTYELAREQKIQFIFGFPNQHSLPGFKRLKWQFLPDQLQVFVLKSGGFSYSRFLNKSSALSALYRILLNRYFGRERITESFFEQHRQDGIRHDNAFLSYKAYNATHIVNIGSVKAWVKADGGLKVGSVQGLNKSNVADFLNHLKKLATRLGCNKVIFITSKGSSLYDILHKELASQDAFPIGFYSLQDPSFTFENVSFEYCDIDIF